MNDEAASGTAAVSPGHALRAALLEVPDVSAEMSDRLEAEGYRLVVPAGQLRPLIPGSRLLGRALTLRYLPERHEPARLRDVVPEGRLGNAALAAAARPGDVIVVQSPARDVSVMGSEAATALAAAGVLGGIVDGAVRDVAGLAALPFPVWSAAVTPGTGRWRLQAATVGEPVAVGGVQVRAGDIVLADEGGVCFVPAERFEELARAVLARRAGALSRKVTIP